MWFKKNKLHKEITNVHPLQGMVTSIKNKNSRGASCHGYGWFWEQSFKTFTTKPIFKGTCTVYRFQTFTKR
jgi:hypothetical protein